MYRTESLPRAAAGELPELPGKARQSATARHGYKVVRQHVASPAESLIWKTPGDERTSASSLEDLNSSRDARLYASFIIAFSMPVA